MAEEEVIAEGGLGAPTDCRGKHCDVSSLTEPLKDLTIQSEEEDCNPFESDAVVPKTNGGVTVNVCDDNKGSAVTEGDENLSEEDLYDPFDSDTEDRPVNVSYSEPTDIQEKKEGVVEETAALPNLNLTEENLDYYKKLYLDQIPVGGPRKVYICVDREIANTTWANAIENGKITVTHAAPGLVIRYRKEPEKSNIKIVLLKEKDASFPSCTGNILDPKSCQDVVIYLTPKIKEIQMNKIFLHELMHALGFQHEHQRKDAANHVHHNKSQEKLDQWEPKDNYIPLTPYDKFSIMHYPVCSKSNYKGDRNNISIESAQEHPKLQWHEGCDPPKKAIVTLSELDKVSLNFLYPPCSIEGIYNPVKCKNGMYYCNRPVMSSHKFPDPSSLFACIKYGPNCPACRILSKPKKMRDDQWQGWSGWVYCKGCGPHYTDPCDMCKETVSKQTLLTQ